MNPRTLAKFTALLAAMNLGYSQDDVTKTFTVTPEKVDTVVSGWRSKVAFLDKISVIPVDAKSGNVISLIPQKITRKVDTAGSGERAGVSAVDSGKRTYNCLPTPQDVKIPYDLLDTWAHLPNFEAELKAFIDNVRGADLITIGWNGTSDATTSDAGTNTMLQDCGIGWPKILQTDKAANYIAEVVAASGEVIVNPTLTIGTAAGTCDYKTFDALVTDMKHMIPLNKRTGNEVVILGDDIISMRDQVLYNGIEKPGDTSSPIANRCGGLPIVEAPHDFPADGVFVGDLKMLQVYVQVSSLRKRITNEDAKSAVVDWLTSNIDWQIADPDCVVFVPAGVITDTARS